MTYVRRRGQQNRSIREPRPPNGPICLHTDAYGRFNPPDQNPEDSLRTRETFWAATYRFRQITVQKTAMSGSGVKGQANQISSKPCELKRGRQIDEAVVSSGEPNGEAA
jgi:hypothetical protein